MSTQKLSLQFKSARAMLLLAAVLAGAAQAQSKRCDLEGKDTTTTPGNAHFRKCLDLASLDGKSINIPSNVSRIDNDGLSLCTSSDSSGGLVDIAYVYDNSGSMSVGFAFIANNGDTTFYEKATNCTNVDGQGKIITNGTVTIQQWNAAGTAPNPKSVPKLVSNAGCTEIAGDAYNFRGKAYRDAITSQHDRSRQSSAGIMSFTGSVANVQDPLVLSDANLATVLGRINAASGGSTDYGPPLDTAKRWLTTSVTSNPKKAIIFLSDGKPNNTNYLPLVDANMPPIYGIYIGKANADTARLFELSQLTKGQFFVIPSNHSDSLAHVVDRILDILLRKFDPDSAAVTNSDMAPIQTAFSKTPSGFQKQIDSSYLMLLSDVVGLKANTANHISVFTKFIDKNTNTVSQKTINFTLSTTLPAANQTQNITSTNFAVSCFDKSSLKIVSVANPATELALLTDSSTGYRIRLRTSPTPLNTITGAASSKGMGDAESPVVSRSAVTADSTVFLQATGSPAAFKVISSGPPSQAGTLEAALYDTVIVSWTHPRDPQDFTVDSVIVQSKNVAAKAIFADSLRGLVTVYPRDTKRVYVVIKDQPRAPGLVYRATIVSGDQTDPLSPRDTIVVSLTEVVGQPGTFVGSAPVSYDIKDTHDNTLQVSVGGDQLEVIYVDPLYNEKVTGQAGFTEGRQRPASLWFTDASGAKLDTNVIWSPGAGNLYVAYTDDFDNGLIIKKTVTLRLDSRKYGSTIGTDHESFDITLTNSSTDTNALWTGSIPLDDVFPPADSNHKAETSFRGEATITAFSHDNTGNPQNTTVSDFLVIANPDSVADLAWKLADTGSVPKNTDGLIITVTDQDFTKSGNDSLLVSARCETSIDSVPAFYAKETASGTYVTGILVEDNGTPNPSDKILSCRTAETVVITYTDPVYGTQTQIKIPEVEKPVATAVPAGNNFSVSTTVTLSDNTPGAVIYYTTDGTRPIPGVSKEYKGENILVFSDTTIKAVAAIPGWKPSKVLTETYTKQKSPSTLVLLDKNKNILRDSITSDVTPIMVRVSTTQGNLSQVVPVLVTKRGNDRETPVLGEFLPGTRLTYSDTLPLAYGNTAVTSNGSIEATGIDTLIATWTNPFDPSDVARDTVIILPAQGVTTVQFTDQAGTALTTYPQTADSIYVRVTTRPTDHAATVTVTTGLGDAEVLTLVQVSPGVFVAKAPVDKLDGLKHPANGAVDVAVSGDQLQAVYTDPVYKVDHFGNAGFNAQVEESARLEFTDKDGAPLTPGTIWNPKEGFVYVRYSDDWNAGIDSKVHVDTAHLVLINTKNGAEISRDNEVLVLTLDTSTATRGVWRGSLKLEDKAPPASGNKSLETNYRGELTAQVTPHKNNGDATTPAVTAKLTIAYPNQDPEIIIRDTSGGDVTRPTTKVVVVIKDQPVSTSGSPTITAVAECLHTGDLIQNVTLVWNGKDAYVAVPPIDKQEGGNVDKSDLKLTCDPGDVLRITYKDPVYGDTRTNQAVWSDDRTSKIYFTSVKDNSVITSVSEAADSTFNVVVEGVSPSRDKVDTIQVVLTTPGAGGDLETVSAVETGPMTGVFTAVVTFGFGSGAPTHNDKKIEAVISRTDRANVVVMTGSATVNGGAVSADIALFSAYDLVASAYIKDEDGDGRGDHVYFVFDHKLPRLPSSIEDVIWNNPKNSSDHQKAGSSMLSFKGSDSTVVVADFSHSEFAAHLTDPGDHPTGTFPDDNLFGGQSAAIADSMGPVIITAIKRPSNMGSYNYTATEVRFNPDTLIIKVSEPLKSTDGRFSGMLLFSKGCSDQAPVRPVRTYSEPVASGDGLTWTIIVDNSPNAELPLTGDCVFLETDGRYTDNQNNAPPLLGVRLEGENQQQVIRVMRGYPPVAGLDASDNGFTTINNDVRNDTSGTWTGGKGGNWVVPWIAPAGYVDGDPDFMDAVERAVPSGVDAGSIPNRTAESKFVTTMSSDISAIQVVSTGGYIANIAIFDHLGNFVRASRQGFGFNGEAQNAVRARHDLAQNLGLVSWLVWDMKDSNHNRVGQGVYVWKVNFEYFLTKPDETLAKRSEIMYTRTGVLRKKL